MPLNSIELPILQKITKIIAEFIYDEKQFTILDVTNALKEQVGKFYRHSDIKDYVKDILELVLAIHETYTSSLITVVVDDAGSQATATLYYPYTTDASDYTNRNSRANKPVDNNQLQNQTSQSVPSNEYRVSVRPDGRLEIPKNLFQQAGIKLGDTLDVNVHPNSITIIKDDMSSSVVFNRSWRLSKSILTKCNLNKPTVTIKVATGKLIVF